MRQFKYKIALRNRKIEIDGGRLTMIPFADLPEEVKQNFAKRQAEEIAFESTHGKVRPIVTAEMDDLRFVAVGHVIHWSPKNTTKCFPDFLADHLSRLLGSKWGTGELAKPLQDRHQILKWHERRSLFMRTQKPDDDGIYRCRAIGAVLSCYRLAYDLYLIRHNAALQKGILNRIRHKDRFQSARFELCVTASMIAAGFEINYEDESDGTRKHAEFIAAHPSGLQIAIEAKSHHRADILDFGTPSKMGVEQASAKAAIGRLLRKAIEKAPTEPYFIFVDVNLQPSEERLNGSPWFKEMAETVENLKAEWQPGTFPVNAIFFCNDPTYHILDEIAEGCTFWCYPVVIKDARYPLPNQELTMQIVQAIMQRTNIPNNFPPEHP